MPSERDKESGKRLKWWYFRPWSPFILSACFGLLISLFAPVVASSAFDRLWCDAQATVWCIAGAMFGAITENVIGVVRSRRFSLGSMFWFTAQVATLLGFITFYQRDRLVFVDLFLWLEGP